MKPYVSIIIANYNGKKWLKDCLGSLTSQKFNKPFEIILVDDASTDGSAEYVKKNFPQVQVITLHEEKGYTGANNIGVEYARGDYVIFVNPDTRVEKDWLKELVKTIESNSRVGAAQSKLLFLDEPKHIQSAGNFIDFYGNVYIRGIMEEDKGQFDKNDVISYASGCALIIRRDFFRKIGMFDPAYFVYSEDADLSWRIWLAGYKVMFACKSVVYHKGTIVYRKGRMEPETRPLIRFHQTKNKIATLLKNYNMKNIVKYVQVPVLIYLRETLYYIVKRRLDTATALAKGVLWNLKNLKYIWKKRLWIKYNLRKVSDDYIKTYVMKKPLLPFPLYFLPIRRSNLIKRFY